MGFAGSLGLVWFALGALRPSPPAAGQAPCPHPLNSSHCRCPPGFEGEPWDRSRDWERHCEDINECLGEGRPPCPPSRSCHNTEGGFRCDCNRGYRPRGGTGTPRNGTGTPENGTGTPENGTGTPENGTGTPENGTGTPKNGTGTPENGTGTPENGTGTPENGTGTPANGSGTPENGTGTPENGNGGTGTPRNGTATPENGTGVTGNSTGTPKNGNETPENGTGTPGNGTGTPENGAGTPENGTMTPENGTGTPENGSETPENGTGTPGNGEEIDCEDVDECAEGGEGLCGGGSICLNTPGSFECHCPPPGRGPPGPGGCPAVPVPPEICGEEEGCDLGETLARISEELRGGRDPRSVLQELLSVLGGALGGSLGSAPPPSRLRRLSALLAAGEGLARSAGARLPPGTVTNVTAERAALSLAVSRGPPPGPVALALPEVTLEVPPEVALDKDSGVSLVALLTLGGLPEALSGSPPVLWGGWGSLPRAPRRGRAFPRWRPLSPVATALVTRGVARPPPAGPAVTLSFRHPAPDPKLGGKVLCAFWNPEKGRWDTGGCRVVPPKNGTPPLGDPPGTVCACDHLTSFAVLLAFNEIQEHWLLDLVTQVALAVSLVALVAAAVTFALCRALAEPRRTLQLHLSLSLLGGHLAFLLGIDGAQRPVACAVTAVALHFWFLSSFCWMALQGAHLYALLVQVFPPAWLRPRPLLALGYGPAAAIVALSAAVFPRGYGTDQYCWLSLERGFRWSFQGPVIAVCAANAAILVVTLWKLVQKFSEVSADMGHLRRTRVLLVTSLGQLALLGSGWALGLGAGLGWAGGAGPPLPPGSAPPPLPLLFCLVNAAQGLLIFLCHCLGHPKVRGWYRSLLCPRWRPYSEFTSHTSNTSNAASHTSMGRARGSQSHQ